jgi:hypothetical protein
MLHLICHILSWQWNLLSHILTLCIIHTLAYYISLLREHQLLSMTCWNLNTLHKIEVTQLANRLAVNDLLTKLIELLQTCYQWSTSTASGQARWSRRCRAYGVRVIARHLKRRPGSGVGDGSVDQARWSRLVTAARGGATSSLGHRGAGCPPRRWATGVDERGSGDRDGGASVTATANFSSLVA